MTPYEKIMRYQTLCQREYLNLDEQTEAIRIEMEFTTNQKIVERLRDEIHSKQFLIHTSESEELISRAFLVLLQKILGVE